MQNHVDPGRERLFNALATGLDREALRYFPFCADRLVLRLQPAPGDKILDVATGTGGVALAAAQAVGAAGRVTAIDIAEGMLARLETKLTKFGIANIDAHVMDGARLDFRRDYFQHVVCSLALFWFADPAGALREWLRVTRPGGSVMLAMFGARTFQPQLGLLRQRLKRSGVAAPVLWESLCEPQSLATLLRDVGYADIDVQEEQLGYHLTDAQQWWEVVWYSGLRALLEPLPLETIEQVRTAHLAEIAPLLTQDGLWLDVPVLFARGRKPLGGEAQRGS